MAKRKITDEQLREELEDGMTKEEIAEKHGMNKYSVKARMERVGLVEGRAKTGLESVPAENCFAYNRFNGDCTCLTIGKCPGDKCGFYKEANRAMEEMKKAKAGNAYERNTFAAMMMVGMNQGISV